MVLLWEPVSQAEGSSSQQSWGGEDLEGLLKEQRVGQGGWSGEGTVRVVGDRVVARMVAGV